MQLYTITGVKNLADAYGAGRYSNCTYNQGSTDTNCIEGTGTGNGALADTGLVVGLAVGVACLLLLAVVLVRFWRRPARSATESATTRPDASEHRNS